MMVTLKIRTGSRESYQLFIMSRIFSLKDNKGKHNFGQNLKFHGTGVSLKIEQGYQNLILGTLLGGRKS